MFRVKGRAERLEMAGNVTLVDRSVLGGDAWQSVVLPWFPRSAWERDIPTLCVVLLFSSPRLSLTTASRWTRSVRRRCSHAERGNETESPAHRDGVRDRSAAGQR